MYDQSKELFETLKYNGKPTGVLKPRGEVHRDGDWHGSIHVWVFNGDEVLLQQRSAEKDVFPGCIDASCTGHIDPGETPEQAARRELKEELGILAEAEELIPLMKQHVTNRIPPLFNREIDHVFLYDKNIERSVVSFQEEEIDRVFFMDVDTLSEKLAAKDPSFCIIPREWKRINNFRKKYFYGKLF